MSKPQQVEMKDLLGIKAQVDSLMNEQQQWLMSFRERCYALSDFIEDQTKHKTKAWKESQKAFIEKHKLETEVDGSIEQTPDNKHLLKELVKMNEEFSDSLVEIDFSKHQFSAKDFNGFGGKEMRIATNISLIRKHLFKK